MSDQNEFFTLPEAIAVLDRTVRVATDRLPNDLPVGTQGRVDGLLRKSPGYLVGITWDNYRGKKGNGLINWFTRLEYDAWLEETPQQEEIND